MATSSTGGALSPFPFSSCEDDVDYFPIKEGFPKLMHSLYQFCKRRSEELEECEKTTIYVLDLRKKGVFWFHESETEGLQFFELQQIKICRKWGDMQEARGQKCVFTLIQNGYLQREEVYHIPTTLTINTGIIPFSLFRGNEVEVSFSEKTLDRPKLEPGFWNDWKFYDRRAASQYRKVIYLAFEDALDAIREALPEEPLTILDIGGGDGELAFRVAKEAYVEKVFVVDSNQESMARAANRQHKDPCKDKVDLRIADIMAYDFQEVIGQKVPQVIFLCGVVALGVLSREESYDLMIKCKGLIREGGYIVISSHSPPYFTAPDYEAMGYQVVNTAFFAGKEERNERGEVLKSEEIPYPLYVLQKKRESVV